jgi:UDP-glucose 4-epimerase
MTRFILTLDEAVETVLAAIADGEPGEIWVRRCPAVLITDLGQAIAADMDREQPYPIEQIGIRPGEKIHEVLVALEEVMRVRHDGNFYRIARTLRDRAEGTQGETTTPVIQDYDSRRARRLNQEEILEMLSRVDWVSAR